MWRPLPTTTLLQVVMLWLWLSYRFDPDTFPQRDKVGGPCRRAGLGLWPPGAQRPHPPLPGLASALLPLVLAGAASGPGAPGAVLRRSDAPHKS